MFELLNLRIKHGRPVIRDIRHAELMPGFRGFPLLSAEKCAGGCSDCGAICPTGALALNPLRLDMGKCIFCGECERSCPGQAVRFSPAYRLGASSREALTITSGQSPEDFHGEAIGVKKEINRLFGRSLKLRQVSAGGCNGCEMELTACGNVNFDMGRFGIDFVASPRHADGIVITGPITRQMAPALKDAYLSVSEPKIVVSVGACAISGGLFADSTQLDRSFLGHHPVDLYVPGCPPHPLTFIHALLDFLQ
jgi:Ni,Fe-hydrogenase III small subunit/NAD-dependent dihydropyrimidine dehydrogenase PreA subunit